MGGVARVRQGGASRAAKNNILFCLQLRDSRVRRAPRRSRAIRPIRAVIRSIRVPMSEEAHHAAVRLGAMAEDQQGLDETTAPVKKLHQYPRLASAVDR